MQSACRAQRGAKSHPRAAPWPWLHEAFRGRRRVIQYGGCLQLFFRTALQTARRCGKPPNGRRAGQPASPARADQPTSGQQYTAHLAPEKAVPADFDARIGGPGANASGALQTNTWLLVCAGRAAALRNAGFWASRAHSQGPHALCEGAWQYCAVGIAACLHSGCVASHLRLQVATFGIQARRAIYFRPTRRHSFRQHRSSKDFRRSRHCRSAMGTKPRVFFLHIYCGDPYGTSRTQPKLE